MIENENGGQFELSNEEISEGVKVLLQLADTIKILNKDLDLTVLDTEMLELIREVSNDLLNKIGDITMQAELYKDLRGKEGSIANSPLFISIFLKQWRDLFKAVDKHIEKLKKIQKNLK